MQQKSTNKHGLPQFFKTILWSYDFSKIDPEKNRKTIIINAINYGDLKHWRWLTKKYGKNVVTEVLSKIAATEIKPRARRLVSVIFSGVNFNYAQRSTH